MPMMRQVAEAEGDEGDRHSLAQPAERRMSTSSFMPCMTEPAPRNRPALKKPCVSRCMMPSA